jgi:hypothetical protein
MIFSSVIAVEIDNFLEVAGAAHGRIKKGIQKKEYGDVLMLVDLWNGMSKNSNIFTFQVRIRFIILT